MGYLDQQTKERVMISGQVVTMLVGAVRRDLLWTPDLAANGRPWPGMRFRWSV